MQIVTLGTGHGSPQPNRFPSSTLLLTQGAAYLIDCGDGTYPLLIHAGEQITDLRACFITHMHIDHTGGLPFLVAGICKSHAPNQTVDVFLPEANTAEKLCAWLSAVSGYAIDGIVRFQVTTEGYIYQDAQVHVRAVKTRHMENNRPSFAYFVETEGKRVLFTGDLTPDFSDFPHLDAPVDLCVCEATHYKPPLSLPTLTAAPIRSLLFSHMHQLWVGNGDAAFLKNYETLPYPVAVAHDGDRFSL